MSRRCEWCGIELAADAPPSKVTCSDSHRALRWRWLHNVPRSGGRGPQEPPEGSPLLNDLAGVAEPTRSRAARRQRRKPSGVQVSYRKALDAVITGMTGAPLYIPPKFAREVAERALREALPARQRERLEARDA